MSAAFTARGRIAHTNGFGWLQRRDTRRAARRERTKDRARNKRQRQRNGRPGISEGEGHSPDEAGDELGRGRDLVSPGVDGLADVEERDDACYREPHTCIGEVAPRADPVDVHMVRE